MFDQYKQLITKIHIIFCRSAIHIKVEHIRIVSYRLLAFILLGSFFEIVSGKRPGY